MFLFFFHQGKVQSVPLAALAESADCPLFLPIYCQFLDILGAVRKMSVRKMSGFRWWVARQGIHIGWQNNRKKGLVK